MDITFNCTKCGQNIAIDEAGAGISVQCPSCGASITVPNKQGNSSKHSSLLRSLFDWITAALVVLVVALLGYAAYQLTTSDGESWRNLRIHFCRMIGNTRLAAEAGDAFAQSMVAFDYKLAENYADAAKWYRKAAEQGDASSQLQLAKLYKDGKGVPQDFMEAETWYRTAFLSFQALAEQGKANAQYWLGVLYAEGNGVSKNSVEAAKWYRKAAEQGDYGAQESLGMCYENGAGVEKDVVEAYKWYNLSATHRYSIAAVQRDSLAEKMTTPEIAEGQRRTSEFLAKQKSTAH